MFAWCSVAASQRLGLRGWIRVRRLLCGKPEATRLKTRCGFLVFLRKKKKKITWKRKQRDFRPLNLLFYWSFRPHGEPPCRDGDVKYGGCLTRHLCVHSSQFPLSEKSWSPKILTENKPDKPPTSPLSECFSFYSQECMQGSKRLLHQQEGWYKDVL